MKKHHCISFCLFCQFVELQRKYPDFSTYVIEVLQGWGCTLLSRLGGAEVVNDARLGGAAVCWVLIRGLSCRLGRAAIGCCWKLAGLITTNWQYTLLYSPSHWQPVPQVERANVCAWETTALAVQLNKLSLIVVSEGPSSPLRAKDQVVCPRGTGWALELSRQSKLGRSPVLYQLGKRASQVQQAK